MLIYEQPLFHPKIKIAWFSPRFVHIDQTRQMAGATSQKAIIFKLQASWRIPTSIIII
jgi:hypothetical protein